MSGTNFDNSTRDTEPFNDYQTQTFGGQRAGQEWKNPGPSGGMGDQGNFTGAGGRFDGVQDEQFGNEYSQGAAPGTTDFNNAGQFQSSGQTAADFGSTGVPKTGPSLGDKVLGTAEKFVGKATKKHDMMERGQERSTTGHTGQF